MKWSSQEKAVINRAVLDRTLARDLEVLLPGRNRTQIQCQLANGRKRLRDGKGFSADSETQKDDAYAVKAQGVCLWCRERLADQTLVSCTVCAEQRDIALPVEIDTSKNQADILPWIFSRHPGQLVSWLPAAKKVVDPFGGSGRLARAVVRRGYKTVFNDMHPLLAPYVRALGERKHDEINLVAAELAVDGDQFSEHYKRVFADPSDDVLAAATVRLAAFNSPNCHLDRVDSLSFAPRLEYTSDSRLWQQMTAEARDWSEVIADHDGRNTAFILDPPYPKTDYYEHNLTWMRFKDLVATLARIRGKFLMVLPIRRNIIELCQKHEMAVWMRRVKMFKGSGRDLVVANYPLGDPGLEPIEARQYGLERTDEQKQLVEDVVKALQTLNGIGSRREIGEVLGTDSPEVLGALARGRAEGRVEKHSRRDYCLPGYKEQPVKALALSGPPMPIAKPEPIKVEVDIIEETQDPIVQVIQELDQAYQDEQPFKIYANRSKVIGDVGDFVATMNELGYEVVFQPETLTW